MNSITQHVPAFINGVEPATAKFQSTAELLAIPWVARWAVRTDGKDFHRFSMSGNHLMAEYDNGHTWWVVGVISNPVDLPAWEAKRR